MYQKVAGISNGFLDILTYSSFVRHFKALRITRSL